MVKVSLVFVVVVCALASAAPAKLDRKALPAWSVPKVTMPTKKSRIEGPTDVFVVDADGDVLLQELATGTTYIARATNKRLTGRVSAPTRYEAFAAVAAQLGVDIASLSLPGTKPTMNLAFPPSSVASLVGTIASLHNANIVVAPVEAPQLAGVVQDQPWDGLLVTIVERAGLSLVTQGSTHYVLAKGATLPPLPKAPNVVVDLEATGATLAQAVAALRGVTKLAVGSCSTTKVNLSLNRVKLAEAVRALEVATGEKLTAKAKCPPKKLGADEAERLKRLATAKSGNKQVFVFDDHGTLAIATHEDSMPWIGDNPRPKANDAWLATFTRTQALYRIGKYWHALVDTTTGVRPFSMRTSSSDDPEDVYFEVREDGVHVFRDEKTEWKVLPLAAK